jgi:ABC-type dipeptide/oligopeptide/nickel transport system permease component
VPVVFGACLLVFTLSEVALRRQGGAPSAEPGDAPAVAEVRREHEGEAPSWRRFAAWASGVLQGGLGRSVSQQRSVRELLVERLPVTLRLVLAAIALAVVLGGPAGVLAAVRPGGTVDFLVRAGALLGVATPAVWLGLMLIVVFAVWLGWLPVSGVGTGGWRHLVLPALALGSLQAGVIARATRTTLLEVAGRRFLRTARAKGLPERAVLLKHALRSAAAPVITITGVSLADLLVGTPLVETVFAWPGLGRLLVTAAGQRDAPLVMGVLLTFALLQILGGFLIDLVHGAADPRLRA